MDPLIEALARQQDVEGLGNNAFARKLGVDKGTWSRLRRGVSGWRSGAIFEKAMRTYPAIVASVALELGNSNTTDVDAQQTRMVPEPVGMAV